MRGFRDPFRFPCPRADDLSNWRYERAREREALQEQQTARTGWRREPRQGGGTNIRPQTKLTITTPNSAIPPSLLLAGLNAYNLWNEHWEHWSHMPPLEERVEYPYQNIRTRNFPWGDGDKVC